MPSSRDPKAEKRFKGFVDTFSRYGRVDTRRVDLLASFEAGYEAVNALLKENDCKHDSYFFLNDHLAFGGICALQKTGIDIPNTVGVVGFNDLGINSVMSQRMTTLATPRRQLGQTVTRNLFARIRGALIDSHVQLPVTLVTGDTTR